MDTDTLWTVILGAGLILSLPVLAFAAILPKEKRAALLRKFGRKRSSD